MDEKQLDWIAHFHKSLSNHERLKIVEILARGETCQCEIFPQIGLSQSTVSAYLNQLVRAGILSVRKEVKKKFYSISDPRILEIIQDIRKIADEKTN